MKLRRFLVCLLIAVSVLAAGLAVWLEVLPRIAYSKRIKQFDCYQEKWSLITEHGGRNALR